MNTTILTSLLATAFALTPARAQFTIDWYSIDSGGGTTSGGAFEVSGTIGQPDASGPLPGGIFEITGGFWVGTTSCYANCDGSTAPPILNINDFQCFLNKYATGDPYANCDQSTSPPTLNANDFQCFLNKFAIGCN